MTRRKELEAAKAAALAEVAAIDAKIAALDEPDWELFGTLLAAAKGRYAPDMVKLADFVVRHAHAFAAAPLMPTAAMTDAEIEELAQALTEKHAIGSDDFLAQSKEFALICIRETLKRAPQVRWPKEAELRDYRVHMTHCNQGEYEGSCKYGEHDCPARRLKSHMTGEGAKTVEPLPNTFAGGTTWRTGSDEQGEGK